jgi:hypothetical protein
MSRLFDYSCRRQRGVDTIRSRRTRARRALPGSPLPRRHRRAGWAVWRYEELEALKLVVLPF